MYLFKFYSNIKEYIIEHEVRSFNKFQEYRNVLLKVTCSHWWEYKMVQLLWKTLWQFLRRLNMELPYKQFHSSVCTQEKWKIRSHKNLYANVRSSIIHNSQKRKHPKCPWQDKWRNKMCVFMQTSVIWQ